MGRVVIAPERIEPDLPVIFLAGPTMGAVSWHTDAIRILQGLGSHFHLASPKRPLDIDTDFTPEMYAEQVDWESHYLRLAGRSGCVMFWLSRERPEQHRCDRAYAQTTRFELAEWKERHTRDGAHLAVGIEEGFTGARYIRRRFAQDCPDVGICDTLEDTCRTAVALLG